MYIILYIYNYYDDIVWHAWLHQHHAWMNPHDGPVHEPSFNFMHYRLMFSSGTMGTHCSPCQLQQLTVTYYQYACRVNNQISDTTIIRPLYLREWKEPWSPFLYWLVALVKINADLLLVSSIFRHFFFFFFINIIAIENECKSNRLRTEFKSPQIGGKNFSSSSIAN